MIVGNGQDFGSKNNAFTIYPNSIKIGNVELTAEKLQKLIDFIDSVELN